MTPRTTAVVICIFLAAASVVWFVTSRSSVREERSVRKAAEMTADALRQRRVDRLREMCAPGAIEVRSSGKDSAQLAFPLVGADPKGVRFDLQELVGRYSLTISRHAEVVSWRQDGRQLFAVSTVPHVGTPSIFMMFAFRDGDVTLLGIAEGDEARVKTADEIASGPGKSGLPKAPITIGGEQRMNPPEAGHDESLIRKE